MSKELMEIRKELIQVQNEVLSDTRTTKVFHNEKEKEDFALKVEKDYCVYQGIEIAIKMIEKRIKGEN